MQQCAGKLCLLLVEGKKTEAADVCACTVCVRRRSKASRKKRRGPLPGKLTYTDQVFGQIIIRTGHPGAAHGSRLAFRARLHSFPAQKFGIGTLVDHRHLFEGKTTASQSALKVQGKKKSRRRQ